VVEAAGWLVVVPAADGKPVAATCAGCEGVSAAVCAAPKWVVGVVCASTAHVTQIVSATSVMAFQIIFLIFTSRVKLMNAWQSSIAMTCLLITSGDPAQLTVVFFETFTFV
jgi:hypothetical protein